EWAVFQEAAELQVKKNECLNQQQRALRTKKSPDGTPNFHIWSSQLAASWMGVKKAELILSKCRTEMRGIDLADIKRYGMDKAYERSLQRRIHGGKKPMNSEWRE